MLKIAFLILWGFSILHSLCGIERSHFFDIQSKDSRNPLELPDMDEYEVLVEFNSTPFMFFGKMRYAIYIGINGVLSFDKGTTKVEFDCNQMSEEVPAFIAPFWSDVSLRDGGRIFYYKATGSNLPMVQKANKQLDRAFPYSEPHRMDSVLVVTYKDVAPYTCENYCQRCRNNFQVIISSRGQESFIIFYYEKLEWVTGKANCGQCGADADGSATVGIYGGQSVHKGKAQKLSEICCTSRVRELVLDSNVNDDGVFVFKVDDTLVPASIPSTRSTTSGWNTSPSTTTIVPTTHFGRTNYPITSTVTVKANTTTKPSTHEEDSKVPSTTPTTPIDPGKCCPCFEEVPSGIQTGSCCDKITSVVAKLAEMINDIKNKCAWSEQKTTSSTATEATRIPTPSTVSDTVEIFTSTGPPAERTTPRPDIAIPCEKILDLAILLDSSKSIKPPDFEIARNFTADLSAAFVQNAKTRLMLINFSSLTTIDIGLDNNLTLPEVDAKIRATRHQMGNTATGDAIIAAVKEFTSKSIPGIPKIMLIITDGHPSDRKQTVQAGSDARAKQIQMYGVAIAHKKFTGRELIGIIGAEERVFINPFYAEILLKLNLLSTTLCK